MGRGGYGSDVPKEQLLNNETEGVWVKEVYPERRNERGGKCPERSNEREMCPGREVNECDISRRIRRKQG